MNILKLFSVLLISLFLLTNCASFSFPDAHDKSFPPDGKYVIEGTVAVQTSQTVILGIFSFGGARYSDLFRKAESRYKKNPTDKIDVVNVAVDKEFFSILGVYTRIDTIIQGTAIRYID